MCSEFVYLNNIEHHGINESSTTKVYKTNQTCSRKKLRMKLRRIGIECIHLKFHSTTVMYWAVLKNWQATIFLISQHNLPFLFGLLFKVCVNFFYQKRELKCFSINGKAKIQFDCIVIFNCFFNHMHVYLCVDNFFHICVWTFFSSIFFTYNFTHRLIEV